ncbi:DUF2934 domain-containing protein [Aquabacter sp. CN5-332]|uniref:DUF2934 domain-containing protein n=1 Tax=Aquabacter sp. CN5-332 TaxID=3156608 RepID=UPI0032B38275
MTDRETRIQNKALQLWMEDGKPEGREDIYRELAKELVAQEDSYLSTTRPVRGSGAPPAEPAEVLENQGEFPTLTDQGEMNIPRR